MIKGLLTPDMKMVGYRHSGLDPVAFQGDSRNPSGMTEMLLDGIQPDRFWIPAFAGMTDEMHFHGKVVRRFAKLFRSRPL